MVSKHLVGKSSKLALMIVLGLLALCCLLIFGYGFAVRQQATAMIADLKMLNTAGDSTQAFQVLSRKYGPRLRPADLCSAEDCAYHLGITNSALSVMHLAPYTELNATFNTWYGKFSFVLIDYRVVRSRSETPIVHVQFEACGEPCVRSFAINPHGRSSPDSDNGIVDFNRLAGKNEREAALSLNVGCLTKFLGCKDITELLPAIWGRSPDGRIYSRLRSTADAMGDFD